MKESSMSYLANPAWLSGGDVWYRICQVTIYNTIDKDLNNPVITFVVDSSQTITTDDNFTFSREDNIIIGYLDTNQTVPAEGSVIFTIGVANNDGTTIGNLPSAFTVNDQNADIPEDHEKPTVPYAVKAVGVGSQTLSLVWEPSTDNVMVGGYLVNYFAADISPVTVQTPSTNVDLSNLVPETLWTVTVEAYDLSNNLSAPSTPVQVKTLAALPDPGPVLFSSAPFVDYAAWPTPQCSQYSQGSGIKNYTLGFLTSAQTDSGPRPCWGGESTIVDSHDNLSYPGDATVSTYGKDDIAALRSAGGDVAISFGGANGNIIEQDITDIPTLVSLYRGVIDNYELKAIDFDFEGGTLEDNNALNRHLSVICQVQGLYPNLKISYTLPVDGQAQTSPDEPPSQGLSKDGVNFINSVAAAGLSPAMINGMTMDFGKDAPLDMFDGCVLALNALNSQIGAAFPQWSSTQIWRRMGATPMFGYNDNGTDFTAENQQQLLTFAQGNNLGCLSGWDATRDYNQGLEMCHTAEHSNIYQCTYVGLESYTYTSIIAGYQHK